MAKAAQAGPNLNMAGSAPRAGIQHGFTYLGLMIIVAVMGVFLALAGEAWQVAVKREKEKELLFIGHQFRQALIAYYERSPPQRLRYPMSLDELLKDPRVAGTQRYLRKIYADPMTGSANWGLIKGLNGEIFGIHSLSEEEPVKKNNFAQVDKVFEGKTKYADWVFVHTPGQYSSQPAQRGF